MTLFQNKYRIESARLQGWDYGSNAMYFVTICTHNRECFFGEIVETPNVETPNVETPKLGVCTGIVETPKLGVCTAKMQLSEIGKMADHFWNEIPIHFPFVELDEYIVMPNHVHGIIIINKRDGIVETPKLGTPKLETPKLETPKLGVSTDAASEKWKSATLGVIINQYKRICTIESRKINRYFAWHPRFHDHIIRNDASYQRIREYIVHNPEAWDKDVFNG